jgi:pyruvate dehydrogenase (quinone)
MDYMMLTKPETLLCAIASTIHTQKMGLDNFQKQDPNPYFKIVLNMYFKRVLKQAINGLQTAIQHAISMKGLLFLD